MPRKGTLINTPTTESPITAKVKFTGYSVIDSTKDTFMVYQKNFISSSHLGNCFQFTDFPVISKFPKILSFKKPGILRGISLTCYDSLVPFQSWWRKAIPKLGNNLPIFWSWLQITFVCHCNFRNVSMSFTEKSKAICRR